MLVEGTCVNGHELVCSMHAGRVTGVRAQGKIRDLCPECGGRPYVVTESGMIPSAAKVPSVPPVAEDPESHIRPTGAGQAPAAAAGDRSGSGRSTR